MSNPARGQSRIDGEHATSGGERAFLDRDAKICPMACIYGIIFSRRVACSSAVKCALVTIEALGTSRCLTCHPAVFTFLTARIRAYSSTLHPTNVGLEDSWSIDNVWCCRRPCVVLKSAYHFTSSTLPVSPETRKRLKRTCASLICRTQS